MEFRDVTDGVTEDHELLVNPNCGIRIMYDYIRRMTQNVVSEDREIDLCDENGNLQSIHKMVPWVNAAEVFPHRSIYYLIKYEYNEGGNMVPHPAFPVGHALYVELMNKLRRHSTTGSKRKSKKSKSAAGPGTKG